MTTPSRGLGRGLDALFRNANEASAEAPQQLVHTLSIHAIAPFAGQPRTHFDPVALEELATSIRNQGIVQPLIVRPVMEGGVITHELVAGERRWRAAKLAGLQRVPVIVRTLSDADAYTVALIENVQREDLNPLEEAMALQHLRERLGFSQEELAAKLGKSRSAVANALRLLNLPQHMQEALKLGHISAGHARAVLAVTEHVLQDALFRAICERGLSVRNAEAAAVHVKQTGALPATLQEQSRGLQSDDDRENAPHKTMGKQGRAPKSTTVIAWQHALRECVHPKATVAGDGAIGRITLPYESEEGLARLCSLLGVERLADDMPPRA